MRSGVSSGVWYCGYRKGAVSVTINIFDETSPAENYRIPDLTFVASGRERLLVEDGIRGGGPDAVIEVRSPGDESYDKLSFFAKLGVREVIVIDRDSKIVEISALVGTSYERSATRVGTALTSPVLGVTFETAGGVSPRLVMSDTADPAARVEI